MEGSARRATQPRLLTRPALARMSRLSQSGLCCGLLASAITNGMHRDRFLPLLIHSLLPPLPLLLASLPLASFCFNASCSLPLLLPTPLSCLLLPSPTCCPLLLTVFYDSAQQLDEGQPVAFAGIPSTCPHSLRTLHQSFPQPCPISTESPHRCRQ